MDIWLSLNVWERVGINKVKIRWTSAEWIQTNDENVEKSWTEKNHAEERKNIQKQF